MGSLKSSQRNIAPLLVIVLFSVRAPGAMITEIVVFGDSLSDTGNVLAATQLSQITNNPFDLRPEKPWYDTGRWTNGPSNTGSDTNAPRTKPTAFGGVWHERLADKLQVERAKSVLPGNGTNWAFGGAASGNGTFAQVLLNVGEQVGRFLGTNPTIGPTQLFALWGGGNDVRDAAFADGATVESIQAAAATALANMKNNIAALAARGAKLFLWPNLPPLERTPEALTMDAALRDGLKQAAAQFRDQQAAAVMMLKDTTPGITIHMLDVHGQFVQIAAKPSDVGVTEMTKGVIDVTNGNFSEKSFGATANFPDTQVDPDTFLFWDQIHPTARTHELIAARALGMIVPEPGALVLAAEIISVFVVCRRRGVQLKNWPLPTGEKAFW
jgi:phospholipase/lecithinase/hemolysin